ncbi:MAG: DUF3857 domain-containing protein [Novosphingobium sp.]|uniref:DUF3857 domain-containing protein n=1 Tax=Novosphingobium sp. TaxID=1874826 RepID=UPI0032B724D7
MKNRFAGASALILALAAQQAQAGDKPLFAPAPDWILPAPPLTTKDLAQSNNFVPLFDEQVKIEGDTTVTYIDTASYIASAETLNQRGTLSLPWRPAHGDLTIHKVEILRGTERIDALQGDPGFTVLRREVGLERLMVDGSLTAVKHIEGLRVGDVLHLSFSLSERDKVLGGRAQAAMLLLPKPLRIGFGRARLIWPQSQQIAWKLLQPGIEVTPKPIAGGFTELSLPMPGPALPEMPSAMPSRFQPVPLLVASGFSSWAEVAAVMAPHYKVDGAIAEGSDLAKAVDAIAARSTDPVRRMADALQLVQEEVRYQLMALDTGNYMPQPPAETWQKRYGDCKAKTVLLMAVLKRLGIESEPVLANTKRGDAVDTMPAAPLAFDHVFVRAELAGESFWLDGTGLGARLEDIRDVPRFGRVLPIRAAGAELLSLPVRANGRFGTDADLAIDHSAGPHLPSPFTLKVRYAGATAAQVRVKEDGEEEEKLRTFAETMAKNWTGSTTIGQPVASYDPKDAIWTVTVDGVSYPDWGFRDGHYEAAYLPAIKIDFDPDRSRSAWRQIPATIDQPWTARSRVRMTLPDGGKGVSVEGADPVQLTQTAFTWERSVTRTGATLVDQVIARESGQEVAPAEISLAKKATADAVSRPIRLVLAAGYVHRWDDVASRSSSPSLARAKAVFDRRITDKPDDAVRLDDRAWLSEQLLDWAAADTFRSKAIALDGTAARYVERSGLRSKMGRQAESLKDAQAAFEIDSGNKDVRYRLAVQLARAGKADEAIDLTAPDADPATDEGRGDLLTRAEVLEYADRHEEAVALLDSALQKRPSVAEFRNARCWYKALRNDDLGVALEDCNRAIELASDPAVYLDSRAMVHFRSGRIKEALADLDGALAMSPEIAASHFMRGVMLGKQGQAAQAAKELTAARKLYPDIDAYLGRYGIKP